MDELLARHRKEQRDLQSQITQKKKSASKKTRKAVNDECSKLEQDVKERQQQEIAAFNGEDFTSAQDQTHELNEADEPVEDDILDAILGVSTETTPAQPQLEDLAISSHEDATSRTSTPPPAPSSQSRKPNRQKVRLARRAADQEAVAAAAAAEASSLPDLKARERSRMLEEFEKRGLSEKEVAANGHCMYSAVADQMRQLGLSLGSGEKSEQNKTEDVYKDDYKTVRTTAAEYMAGNAEDFVPFLEEPLQEYLHKVKDTGEWGGQLELLALAKAYEINIHVLQGDGRVEEIEGASSTPAKDAWLAYYRHGFGLGEHYNSLRKVTTSAPKE